MKSKNYTIIEFIENLKFLGENLKNERLETKNQKLTLNISKLEYLWAFWRKIQNWKFLGENLKNEGPGIKNRKLNSNSSELKYFEPFW